MDQFKIKDLLKWLGYIDIVAGSLGSVFLAFHYGQTVDDINLYFSYVSYERDWVLTLGLFAGSFFGVMALFAILMGLAEILEGEEQKETAAAKLVETAQETAEQSEEHL